MKKNLKALEDENREASLANKLKINKLEKDLIQSENSIARMHEDYTKKNLMKVGTFI